MKLFVQVTFDLEDARKPEYQAVESWLNGIGLQRSLPGPDGMYVTLPSNTFAGIRDCYSTVAEAIDHVEKQFGMSAMFDFCQGRAFITASPAGTTLYRCHKFGL